MRWFFLILLLGAVVSNGCMYEGPTASPSEVASQKARLEAKALRYRLGLLGRVKAVGYRILKALPPRFRSGDNPYLGLIVIEDDDAVSFAYGTPGNGGAVVVSTVKGSLSENLDIAPGSLVSYLGNWRVDSVNEYKRALKLACESQQKGVELGLWNISYGGYERYVRLEHMPLDIEFVMSSDADINSMATPGAIIVTYGMMKFIESDDELAVVLGHELSHIVLGHHVRTSSLGIVSSLLSNVLGSAVDSKVPGLGPVAGNVAEGAVQGYFSRDMERQADYWGLYFAYRAGYDIEKGIDIWERFAIEVPESLTRNFFATHPSSVERRVYIEKIVKQLENGQFPE